MAGLAYLLGVVSGLVVLLLEPRDRFVRFAALESILLSVAVAHHPPGSAVVAVWLVCMVRAFQGRTVRRPFPAEWADRWAGPAF
ncbi:conserved protein of unknown function [Candidatus Hydrogenisulfobacillus filiaventi]|uniref:Uncharacterized protein n=1 Tax=Candidatus Hydrogenisulfobacillus filiaventi TaxID=2707344 RepID=A0A6F8ZDM3_9FIRM|nr:hypothetical protein [Bacillota bacterium]CAB1127857.1 conserved protein of unknown function [Candidatus Hydrogenisulfobacillus filiaventi]